MTGLRIINGAAWVLFVLAIGACLRVVVQSEGDHRAARRTVVRHRLGGRDAAPLTLYAVALLVEIRAGIAYGQTRSAIHSLSTSRPVVAVAHQLLALRRALPRGVGSHRLYDQTDPNHYAVRSNRHAHHTR